MTSNARTLVSVLLLSSAALSVAGCQSQLDKCKKTTDETAARQLAECKDAACKQKAEADRRREEVKGAARSPAAAWVGQSTGQNARLPWQADLPPNA
jgi:hypothetical protein